MVFVSCVKVAASRRALWRRIVANGHQGSRLTARSLFRIMVEVVASRRAPWRRFFLFFVTWAAASRRAPGRQGGAGSSSQLPFLFLVCERQNYVKILENRFSVFSQGSRLTACSFLLACPVAEVVASRRAPWRQRFPFVMAAASRRAPWRWLSYCCLGSRLTACSRAARGEWLQQPASLLLFWFWKGKTMWTIWKLRFVVFEGSPLR